MTTAPADTATAVPASDADVETSRTITAGSRRRVTAFHWALLAIAVAGFAFRAGYVIQTRNDASLCGSVLCGDAIYYSGQANVIGLGHGFQDPRDWIYPAADHPPLTALILAPVTAVLGDSTRLATQQRLVVAFFGALVIVAIGFLGRRVGRSGGPDERDTRGPTVGLVAAGIAAAYSAFWMNDVIVMSETFATLGIVLTLLACYRFVDAPTWRRAAVVGALIGLTVLCRAELLLFAPITFVPLVLWARALSWGQRLGRIAAAAVAVAVVLAPWTLYNVGRFEQPVLMSTNDGLTLVGANCDPVYGIPDKGGIGFWNLGCAMALGDKVPPGADQSVASQVYRDEGIAYIRSHLGHLPEVELIRVARMWGVFAPDQMVWLNMGEGRTNWASWLGYFQWWALMVPAVVGAVILKRRGTPIWTLASTAIIVTLTAMGFYGIVRFRLAADVAAVVLAAVAVEALVHRLRSRRPAGAPITLS